MKYKEKALSLSVSDFNYAMDVKWEVDKVEKNLSGDLSLCEFCGRKYVISCICDEGEKKWQRVIDEVKSVSEARQNENTNM